MWLLCGDDYVPDAAEADVERLLSRPRPAYAPLDLMAGTESEMLRACWHGPASEGGLAVWGPSGPDAYSLEFEGGTSRRSRAGQEYLTPAEVVGAFRAYLRGEPGWQRWLTWSELNEDRA